MGIYIKHMKMPNSCVECPLYKESVCDAFETLAPYTFKDNERASFCPLTEVAEPSGDLISRADAIRWVKTECNPYGKPTLDYNSGLKVIEHLKKMPSKLPSAEAVSREVYEKRTQADELIIDSYRREFAEAASAEAEWIPCSKDLPKELEPVVVTWINHNPPCYYIDIMGKPFTAMCVLYNGNWYWWHSTICDVLAEYGEECGAEPIDKYIEITAWKTMPEPYREEKQNG